MEKKNYIVGVDIGSSNVVVAVGCRRPDGKVSVEGIALQSVDNGVTSGRIDNAKSVGMAISKAKTELEEELGIRIDSAYAGISGSFVRCATCTDHVFIKDPMGCIAKEDLASLHERMCGVMADDSEQIMERIPQTYIIDNTKETTTPVGAFGRMLSATYLFVLCNKVQIDRVKMAFHNAGLQLIDICVNPSILPSALLSDEEREDGVAVIDLGGGTTDVAIVKGGALRYIASLPIGASTINADMCAAGISERKTESIKKKYGSAVAESVSPDATFLISMPGLAKKEFLQVNLASIIEARLKDIIEFAWGEIRSAKFTQKIPCGIVLTGGSALLDNIDELFHRETCVNVRLATAQDFGGIDEESQCKIQPYANSAAVALLLYGARNGGVCGVSEPAFPRPNSVLRAAATQPQATPSHEAVAIDPIREEPVKHEPVAAEPIKTEPVKAEPKPTEPTEKPTQEPADVDYDDDDEERPKEKRGGIFGKIANFIDNVLGGGNNNEYL